MKNSPSSFHSDTDYRSLREELLHLPWETQKPLWEKNIQALFGPHDGSMWGNRLLSFIAAFIPVAQELHTKGHIVLSWDWFTQASGDLNLLGHLATDPDFSGKKQKKLLNYLLCIPGSSRHLLTTPPETTCIQHGYIVMSIIGSPFKNTFAFNSTI